MKNYLDDLGKDMGNLAEVNNLNLHYRDYELILFDSPWKDNNEVPINQEWYLMGTGYQGDKGAESKFSNPNILASLINLSLMIVNNNGLDDELSFYEDIKSWCINYGLPYYEEYFMTQYFYKNGVGGIHAFRLGEFKRRLAMLHDAFQLWYGLAFDDKEKVIKYSAAYKIKDEKKLDEQLPFLKESLSYTIWTGMNAEISIRYNKDTDSYEMLPCTDSLISVAYFQLAMLMLNNGTKKIDFCSMCKNIFEIEHGNTKICGNCKREYHRIKTQESRARKKKGDKANA